MLSTHPQPVTPAPATITCPLYEVEAGSTGSTRCRHYPGAGICAVQAPRMAECSEWRKLNPTMPVPAALVPQERTGARSPSAGLPLFDRGAASASAARAAATPARVPHATAVPEVPAAAPPLMTSLLRTLTDADIASWKALGVEVCMATECGDVWLVPDYRDSTRREISIEHAARLVDITNAFPGARVRAMVPVDRTEATSS